MVHGRIGTAAGETIYASGGGISQHQIWGLGGDDTLFGWTPSNPDLDTNDELYGDRQPLPGQIQYNPAVNPPGIPGNDAIYGGAGYDKLYGDEGDDWLNGGTGNDTLDGGAGFDFIDYSSASGGVSVDLYDPSVNTGSASGADGNDRITAVEGIFGSNFNDALEGENNANSIYGNGGHDFLDGGIGSDFLDGGSGNDTLSGGSEDDDLRGDVGDDKMYGGFGNDYLDGWEGNDYLEGYDGNDVLVAWKGNDLIYGGYGDDWLDGSYDNDTLYGGEGNDTLGNSVVPEPGDDKMYGENGNDLIYGGDGIDYMDGGSGNDTMQGGYGNDTYVVDSSFDVINETSGTGIETVISSVSYNLGADSKGLDHLTLAEKVSASRAIGNGLTNTLKGNSYANTLDGRAGTDTLDGRGGNDILVGGTGNDTLTGGAGKDTFVFQSKNEGIDRILDFSVVDDAINVSKAGFGGAGLNVGTLLASQFTIGSSATSSNQRFIYEKTTGKLFFDADGSGFTAKLQIGTLSANLGMTNNDIFVIG